MTSDSVCEIAKSLGWHVERRPVRYDELPSFTEVMAAGTAAALVPVKSITMRSKNDRFIYGNESEEPGQYCIKLLTTLQGIQQGKIKDQFGWLDYVKEAKEYQYIESKAVNAPEVANGDSHSVDKLP